MSVARSFNNRCDSYYPRLQVNNRGEIVLAMSKKETLTTGVLVGKTLESNSKLEIGTKWVDWEVAGELTDYDGQVTVTFENEFKVFNTKNSLENK